MARSQASRGLKNLGELCQGWLQPHCLGSRLSVGTVLGTNAANPGGRGVVGGGGRVRGSKNWTLRLKTVYVPWQGSLDEYNVHS